MEIFRLFTIMSTTMFLDWSSGKSHRPLFAAAYERHQHTMPTPAIQTQAFLHALQWYKKQAFQQVVDHILLTSLRSVMTTVPQLPLPERPSVWGWMDAPPLSFGHRF